MTKKKENASINRTQEDKNMTEVKNELQSV